MGISKLKSPTLCTFYIEGSYSCNQTCHARCFICIQNVFRLIFISFALCPLYAPHFNLCIILTLYIQVFTEIDTHRVAHVTSKKYTFKPTQQQQQHIYIYIYHNKYNIHAIHIAKYTREIDRKHNISKSHESVAIFWLMQIYKDPISARFFFTYS